MNRHYIDYIHYFGAYYHATSHCILLIAFNLRSITPYLNIQIHGARALSTFLFTTMEFVDFVNNSPTPYHAVRSSVEILEKAGYSKIKESEVWDLKAGGKYYVTRNSSSIIAFNLPQNWKQGNPAAIVGAHTDSPTMRLKPNSKVATNGYVQLGVEMYGGGLWPTWFDRDLSVAGRVYYSDGEALKSALVSINKPILRIPTIAIHLHREQGTKLEFNKETRLKPILELQGTPSTEKENHPSGLMSVIASDLGIKPEAIKDFELVLFDTQKAVIGGLNDEFVFSPRLDNLNSCFCSLKGLVAAENQGDDAAARVISLFDHEEIGSVSAQGAASNFLETILARINGDLTPQSIARSLLVSADMAHAVHPNYPEKHESNHCPRINGGPVVKVNANQRYATNSYGSVALGQVAEWADVPLQKFVVRNDSACGSTIGPMLSSQLGMTTVDIGNPQLSMHSIRETGGVKDIEYSIKLYQGLFETYGKAEKLIEKD